MVDCELEIQDSEIAIISSSNFNSDQHEIYSTRVKKPFRAQEIIQNIAIVDIVFAVSHLCHFFFRLTKFTFHNLQGCVVYLYEFCWIALFAVYLLQFFMGSSLFLAAKDVKTIVTLKHLISICTWWFKCSIFIIIVHFIDGLILSVPMNVQINKDGEGQKYLILKMHLMCSLSLEIVANIGEFIFRFLSLIWVRKFVRKFYKLDINFPCDE